MPEPSVLIVPLSHFTLHLTYMFERHSYACPRCGMQGQEVCRFGAILLNMITDEILRHDCNDALAERES